MTYQAVSKWENDTGMLDISQVVPLASIFGVNTDVLFGIADTTENEEAWKIVQHAGSMKKYGEFETYLNAYDILLDGLKKYPNNLIIMINCMNLGISLSLPENGRELDRKYIRIDELTPEILNAFVDKIVVHERKKKRREFLCRDSGHSYRRGNAGNGTGIYAAYQSSANRLNTGKGRRKYVLLPVQIFFIPIWFNPCIVILQKLDKKL